MGMGDYGWCRHFVRSLFLEVAYFVWVLAVCTG